MTAAELLSHQLDDLGKQLTAVLAGLSPDQQDHKLHENGFSPRETLEHLAECYQAFSTSITGGKHQWGSFSTEDKSWANLERVWADLRAKALDMIGGLTDPEHLKAASEFLVLHDAYHVGQLAAGRLQAEPGWDPYSIYSHG
jgi:uncharacterized damage-inducible protein DinB